MTANNQEKPLEGVTSTAETPNEETRQALKDAQEGKNLIGPFSTVEELMAALNVDDDDSKGCSDDDDRM